MHYPIPEKTIRDALSGLVAKSHIQPHYFIHCIHPTQYALNTHTIYISTAKHTYIHMYMRNCTLLSFKLETLNLLYLGEFLLHTYESYEFYINLLYSRFYLLANLSLFPRRNNQTNKHLTPFYVDTIQLRCLEITGISTSAYLTM